MLKIGESAGLGDLLEPHQLGYLEAWRALDASWHYRAAIRPGLSERQLLEAALWVVDSLLQLHDTNDPAGAGWYPSDLEEDHWYLAVRPRLYAVP